MLDFFVRGYDKMGEKKRLEITINGTKIIIVKKSSKIFKNSFIKTGILEILFYEYLYIKFYS